MIDRFDLHAMLSDLHRVNMGWYSLRCGLVYDRTYRLGDRSVHVQVHV